MPAFIEQLFSKKDVQLIRSLWEDQSVRSLLQKEIGKKLIDQNKIVSGPPLTQIMLVVSLSPFAESDKECNDISCIIFWGIDKADIFPLITEHKNKELAYRCLLSTSLFKEHMDKKWKYHGAPSTDFYRKVGIQTFKNIGMEDIGNHFDQWGSFINEMFI